MLVTVLLLTLVTVIISLTACYISTKNHVMPSSDRNFWASTCDADAGKCTKSAAFWDPMISSKHYDRGGTDIMLLYAQGQHSQKLNSFDEIDMKRPAAARDCALNSHMQLKVFPIVVFSTEKISPLPLLPQTVLFRPSITTPIVWQVPASTWNLCKVVVSAGHKITLIDIIFWTRQVWITKNRSRQNPDVAVTVKPKPTHNERILHVHLLIGFLLFSTSFCPKIFSSFSREAKLTFYRSSRFSWQ